MEVRWNLSGEEIERESFRTIEAECDLHIKLPAPEWRVVRRLIHTTADPRIADTLVFRHDAVASGLKALRSGAPIFCDSKMIRSGLSLARLRRLNPGYGPERLHCHIDDPDVLARAKAEGRTRALCSAEKARPLLDGAIVLIGNAPLALARIARYVLEESARPALVVGMPVGFVNVVESKALLARCAVPQIALEGRRGGSALRSPRCTPSWRAPDSKNDRKTPLRKGFRPPPSRNICFPALRRKGSGCLAAFRAFCPGSTPGNGLARKRQRNLGTAPFPS